MYKYYIIFHDTLNIIIIILSKADVLDHHIQWNQFAAKKIEAVHNHNNKKKHHDKTINSIMMNER